MKAFTGQVCVQHTNLVKVCGCIGPGYFNNIAYICGWANIFRACGTLVKQAASVVDLINEVHYDFDGYDVHIFTHLLSLFGVRLAILLLFCCYSCFSAKLPHNNSHLFTMSHSPRVTHSTSWHLWALILSTWDLLPRSNSLHGDILCKVAEATSQQSAPPEKKEKKGKQKVNTGAMHCEGLYCRLVDKPSMWEFLDLSGIQATKVQKVHLTHETKLCTFS